MIKFEVDPVEARLWLIKAIKPVIDDSLARQARMVCQRPDVDASTIGVSSHSLREAAQAVLQSFAQERALLLFRLESPHPEAVAFGEKIARMVEQEASRIAADMAETYVKELDFKGK